MLSESLAALAGAGATSLVGAMATDAWQVTRERIARLFRHGDQADRAGVVALLDADAETLAQAGAGDMDELRAELETAWQRRLKRLLAAHPAIEVELRELVRGIEALGGGSVWVQRNVARDHATQFAVQGGNVVYHQAPEPPDEPSDQP